MKTGRIINKIYLDQSSRRTKLAIVCVFGLLFFSAYNNDDRSSNFLLSQTENIPITFNISIGTDMTNGVSTNNKFKSAFKEGDEIGIFAIKRSPGNFSETLQPSENYIHNSKLTYNGKSWVGEVYYPNSEDVLDFYAYYPYDANNNNPTKMTFNIQTDQSTTVNFSKSDLMTAKAYEKSKGMTVSLTFSHRLAMIEVKVKEGMDYLSMNKAFSVELKNVATKMIFDWDRIISTTPADINMYSVPDMPDTYRALIPAQTIKQGVELLGFEQKRSFNFVDYISENEMELVAGYIGYIHDLKIEAIDPNHIYSIGDVYPYKGIPKGIVYQVSNGGKNGMVVSLDQSSPLMWCNYKDPIGIPYTNSGIWNMHILQSYINQKEELSWDKFPAFSWVHKKNKPDVEYDVSTAIWFLPAIDELVNLYNVYKTDKFEFDKKITEAGGSPILLYKTYWSSTENYGDKAATVYFGRGSVFYDHKAIDNSARVRCILAF